MIVYRHHRGSLDEAMKTARTFENEKEMIQNICDDLNAVIPNMVSESDIVIGDIIGDDDRIGWKNVRHVLAKRFGPENYVHPQCIGFCAKIE